MSELRYNRDFKKAIAAIMFCIILFGSVVVFFIISKVQYDRLVSDMQSIEATIVDIDLDIHIKGPDEQEIYIEYIVDEITYKRKLKTDTAISFAAGIGAHYSVGDKIPIFYDPQNPEIIASPRSVSVGYFFLVFSSFFLLVVLFSLWRMIKRRHTFLVTQEEYDKEGEELKKIKSAKKQPKKQTETKEKKNAFNVRKILKVTVIVILSILLAFMLFHFFRGFIRGLTN